MVALAFMVIEPTNKKILQRPYQANFAKFSDPQQFLKLAPAATKSIWGWNQGGSADLPIQPQNAMRKLSHALRPSPGAQEDNGAVSEVCRLVTVLCIGVHVLEV